MFIFQSSTDTTTTVVDEATTKLMMEQYGNGKIVIQVDSIEPEGGPITGSTRVLVRGGPFKNLQGVYSKPKCKFGRQDMIVDATYVTCTQSPTATEETEAKHAGRNDTCLQCDNSPEITDAEIVPFTVSLTGDFSDAFNSLPYRYYRATRIYAIKPRYGPKDGESVVEIWGENFLNFDENTRCNFGSKSVIAHYVSSTYMTCISPQSDVVQKAISFSVSLNKQQNSKDSIDFWYYNWQSVTELLPNFGPDSGGNTILIKGQNFNPFKGENIDNSNDTFCLFEGIAKVKATVINSTKLTCVAPPNYVEDKTIVEVTFNDQQYTDDNQPYYYYRPPQIFDIDPREGPTKGGTVVTVFGSRFKESKNISCRFGENYTRGTFIDTNKIRCVSPAVEKPGYVPLSVAYEGEKYSSDTVQYLYYETPELYNITPTCGPVTGYTQLTVVGKNFLNMGFGKVKCIFNETIYMNATILEENIIKCDSPPLPPNMGFSDSGAPFYNVEVTLNGKEQTLTDPKIKFIYYIDPQIKNITTNKGPIKGGTVSRLNGKGFNQEGVCNVTVRYGAIQQKINNFTDNQINVTSPAARIPTSVVVSIALNGQQFINDKTLHFRDYENTFTYYQDFFIEDYSPKAGPTTGKTLIKIGGKGFQQFKYDNGTTIVEPIYIRFLDQTTLQPIGNTTEVFDNDGEQLSWLTPPANADTKAIMQMSFNQEDWQNVIPSNQSYSYQYYNAPIITSISPAYGPVKSPHDEQIEISGQNFNCPDTDCKDLYVRFGDPQNGIYVKGSKTTDGKVKVKVPKYTKPDVLPVEVTFNGQDYTTDNKTYGFFDPYILDVIPRLISTKGTTKVRLYGFGFVNSTGTDLKTKIGSVIRGNLSCNSAQCIQMSTYIDKVTIESPTFPQSQVLYGDNGDNIQRDGMAIEGCVYGNTYTENNIEIFYYEDPIYQSTNIQGTPANLEVPIQVKTDFKWSVNDINKFDKFGNFTCRFTSTDGKRVAQTKARMETLPYGSRDATHLPNHVKCQTPKWKTPEQVKLDVSVNGQDFSGDLPFTFYDVLDLYRIVPMAGPNEGNTKVKLYGSGFTAPKEDVFTKWGVVDTQKQQKDQVIDYIWSESDFIAHGMVDGSEILQAYKKEAYNVEKFDYELTDGDKLKTFVDKSPKLVNYNKTHGGPVYMSVGEQLAVSCINHTYDENNLSQNVTYNNKTVYIYSNPYVEYYYYQTPVIKKVEPKSGLTRGGTRIEISGAWFKYMPEYGIVPHCKIGDKVSRAQFFSTVRIVCIAPPNEDINQLYPLLVSLNGVDYIDSGFTFHYYEQPILYSMSPRCGPESGGTQIYITGAKFSNISDPENFKCRFTDTERDMPPKYIPAYYENQTTIMCSSPGGWGRGDAVKVQVTFNGEDYSDNNFTFYYYNIIKATPRSGPSDGSGGPILIIGSGFRNDTPTYCSLDKTLYEPLEITNDVIKCPMVASKSGSTFFGNVDLAIVIDGNWHKFTGGFQYYEQPDLDDMYPHIGPSEGKGIIYFYGSKFRDDFELADVGCKIGDAVGRGKVINSGAAIKCIVEEMSLVDEGFSLPATVALNSYSWLESNQTFVPYGMTALYPNSGPIAGNTDVLITGKGFSDELAEKAKCRFGINANYAVVEAEILSYDKLICRSPPEFQLPSTSDSTISIPIGIAFQEEEFEPWTESTHRYRFYGPPQLVRADPDEIDVGKMSEVYVFADDSADLFEPIPTGKGTQGQYGIQCKFGRFGVGMGMYVNKTTIKCLTPSVQDDPDSIWRETVKITVALNGQDFDDDNSDVDFTFVGTGSTLVFWPYIIATLLIGLLLVAIIVFCSALLQKFSFEKMVAAPSQAQVGLRLRNRAYVIRDPYDQFTSRAYTSGMIGRQSASSQN